MNTKTRFIVLEGIDGSGTTTQARRLAHAMSDALYTCEPTNGPIGRLIREALSAESGIKLEPRTLALLFAADRQHHIKGIQATLDSGVTVVCDRYALSSWVYQGLELPLGWIREINHPTLIPDLTLVLDVDPAIAAARRARRSDSREIFDVEDIQRRLADRYRRLTERTAGWPGPIQVVDASASSDEVYRRISAVLEEAF